MTEMDNNPSQPDFPEKTIGRNEPCPCGSGKKYKRCHGVSAAPKITPPASAAGTGAAGGLPSGFDPSSLDPQAMMPLIQAMQRLPKGQLQRLQGIMQKAMAGKDVSREATELERTLPAEFQELVKNFKMPGAAPATEAVAQPEMTPEQAREIIEKAAAEGKIPKEQADTLLAARESAASPAAGQSASEEGKKGLGRFFKKLGSR